MDDKALNIVNFLEKIEDSYRLGIVEQRGGFCIFEVKPHMKRKVNVEVKERDDKIWVVIPSSIYHPDVGGDNLSAQETNIVEKIYLNHILEALAKERKLKRYPEFDPKGHIQPYFGVAIGAGNEFTEKEHSLVARVSDVATAYHTLINLKEYDKALKFYMETHARHTSIAVSELLLNR